MQNSQTQKLNQPTSCCENQCAACKCKVPMIVGGVIFSLVMLVLGIYLGKTYFGGSTPSTSVVPTPIVSAPTVSPMATSSAALANWKTYENEKMSVELKYPSDWNIFPGNESNLESKWSQFNLLDLKSPDIKGELIIQEGAELIVTVIKPNNETLKQFVENILKQKAAKDSSFTENYNFYGLTGYLIVNTGKTTDGKIDISREIYFEKDNLFYGIIYVINGKNKENNSKTIDQILSTFKFTEKNPEGEFCGGFAGVSCPAGYTCKLDGSYPNASGKCEKL